MEQRNFWKPANKLRGFQKNKLKKYGNRDVQSQVSVLRKAVTLTELMIVVAIIGILFVAVQPYFYTLRKTWHLSDGRSDMLQNGRIGLDKMVKQFREATALTSITASAEAAGHIVFRDKDDNQVEFKRYNDGVNNMLGFVQSDVTSPLAGPIDSLKFTGYEEDGVTITTDDADIRSIAIELVVADPRGEISAMTLSSRVFIRVEPVPFIVRSVNEIMYNPDDSISGNEDKYYEYVEFYNGTPDPIDFAGWQLSNGGFVDDIIGDSVYGDGSTIVPSGGYALITDGDTKVYDGLVYTVSAEAIRLRVDDNNIANGLHNHSDSVIILDSDGNAVDSITYEDSWGAGGSDGLGDSLERISASGPPNDPANWEDSVLNGTPGYANN